MTLRVDLKATIHQGLEIDARAPHSKILRKVPQMKLILESGSRFWTVLPTVQQGCATKNITIQSNQNQCAVRGLPPKNYTPVQM